MIQQIGEITLMKDITIIGNMLSEKEKAAEAANALMTSADLN
jgi:hypothetical protein